MKWIFNQNVPDEVRQSVEPLLPEVQPIIPSWYEVIYIHWDDSDNETTLKYRSDYAYRKGELWICPPFLGDAKPRLATLIHEIAGHCVNGPLQRFCQDTIDLLVDEKKDPILHEMLSKQIIERIEATSCDWEYGIQRLIESLKDSQSRERESDNIAMLMSRKPHQTAAMSKTKKK